MRGGRFTTSEKQGKIWKCQWFTDDPELDPSAPRFELKKSR